MSIKKYSQLNINASTQTQTFVEELQNMFGYTSKTSVIQQAISEMYQKYIGNNEASYEAPNEAPNEASYEASSK